MFRVSNVVALAKRREMRHHQYIGEAIGERILVEKVDAELKEYVGWDH